MMKRKNLIAYVPVIHSGYLAWFSEYRDANWYVLGKSFLDEFPRLKFDIRALSPEDARRSIQSHFRKKVVVLEKGMLPFRGRCVMPREDIMETLAQKYFTGNPVVFENIFLRFDMRHVTSVPEKDENPIVLFTEFEKEMMKQAIVLAGRSPDWWRQVGALAVKDGKVLYSAYNTHFPTEYSVSIDGDPRSNFVAGEHTDKTAAGHAEAMLIADASAGSGGLKGATLYVSVFPCPTCSYSIVRAGVSRVYYSEGYSLLHAAEVFRKNGIELIRVVL
jgi:dCMP deaminase